MGMIIVKKKESDLESFPLEPNLNTKNISRKFSGYFKTVDCKILVSNKWLTTIVFVSMLPFTDEIQEIFLFCFSDRKPVEEARKVIRVDDFQKFFFSNKQYLTWVSKPWTGLSLDINHDQAKMQDIFMFAKCLMGSICIFSNRVFTINKSSDAFQSTRVCIKV